MTRFFLIFLSTFTCFCNPKIQKNQANLQDFSESKSFEEIPKPKEVIQECLRKLSLPSIEKGVVRFEIRLWEVFTNDSFPISMQRYFIDKGKFNGEVYLFSSKSGRPISSIDQLKDSIEFKMKSFSNIPINYADSLLGPYNLLNIDTFDVKKILRLNEAGYVIGMPGRVLIEQATASKYISIFMTHPTSFANLDVNIKASSNFIRFVNKKMLGFNSEIETWSNNEISLIRKNF
jgi:hypothetical protein